jgi:asparagine synthase (glutamine-hydrolysing)
VCGVTGFWDRSGSRSSDEQEEILRRMTAALHHRGPDDQGSWLDPATGVGLGHARLSIIDLSPLGHQPMPSACGRYWIVFNGEIYNHAELRQKLEPENFAFRGHSDTEVLLAGISAWGLTRTVDQSIGMFAFALWDKRCQTLSLVRDRLGIKPLYYGWCGKTFLFGSELKALRAHPAFQPDIDRGSLALFMRYGYVPTPRSIYQGIRKVPPGTIVTLTADSARFPEPEPYWSLRNVAEQGVEQPFRGTFDEAVGRLDALLTDSVRLRMIADVPLGAFLSGGIDSSTVVALMQKQSSQAVKTFTIGFTEQDYNEAASAKEVAKHLGTDHTEQYVTPQQALDVIPKLSAMYDEPFADSSQIPTFLVSQLARRQVTVSLSGDGGDELFCGYNRYFDAFHYASLHRVLPARLRRFGSSVLQTLSQRAPSRLVAKILRGGARVLNDDGPEARYIRCLGHWHDEPLLVLDVDWPTTLIETPESWPKFPRLQQRWMYLDAITYLPDDILTKVDRASMFVALEARVPIIDHRVVEFAWSLPHDFKTDGWKGKRILRSLLARYVPVELFERPKRGFGVPIDHWLRGPLRGWAEELVSESRLKSDGYLDPGAVRRKWSEHQSGRVNWHYALWNVLMFQSWLKEQ